MMLFKVVLLDTIYPCWAYALARIGRKDLFTESWLTEEMPSLLKPYSGQLTWNDICVWENSPDEAREFFAPVSIAFDGAVISKRIKYNYHVGVIESSARVSDMVPGAGPGGLPFEIRLRNLADLSKPDFFIEYDQLIPRNNECKIADSI